MVGKTNKQKTNVEKLIETAELGNAEAQIQLGDLYCDGDVVERDFKMARKWYEKATKHGCPEAQYSLGWLYDEYWRQEEFASSGKMEKED